MAVYREDLLHVSECFVIEPARLLTRYRPVLVGTRRVPGAPAPDLPSVVLTDGPGLPRKARVAVYRTGGGVGLRRRVASLRPSLIHAHFGPDGVQAMPLARRLGVPLVVTTHGYDVLGAADDLAASHRGRRYLASRARLGQEAALLLPVSDYVRRHMIDQGFPAERTRRHYLGIDTGFFDPAALDRAPRDRAPNDRAPRDRAPSDKAPRDRAGDNGPAHVLFVGRLVPIKGVDHVLQAVADVARTQPGIRLTIAGDGPERRRLEAMARDLRIDARFVGACARDAVRSLLADADVVVGGSHTRPGGATEAFGLTLVEAQAMAVPVVAYATGGVIEAVDHGETGLLAAEGDIRGLAANLRALCENRESAAAMGRRGRRRVLDRFDMARQSAALESLYDEVVAG